MSRGTPPFRLTIIHPCVGRHAGRRPYISTWKMEPIPVAMLAALTPPDVERRFYDDRMESIPYDEPTDLVAISVETYTARRAYQIATQYRLRGIPVVLGGFHATLCPDEVQQYCESIVIGEAEELFPRVLDDYRSGRPRRVYRAEERPRLTVTPDRSIFAGKSYLPIQLVEFARGCRFHCDFCAIQSFFGSTHTHRSIECVLEEVRRVRRRNRMIFFIDDNITSGIEEAKELMRALIPLRISWVSQSAINAAYDDELLDLMRRSGCQAILVGFESLAPDSLREMNKSFNLMKGGPSAALANFRRHKISVYGTFVFGYDHDTADSVREAVEFAKQDGMFIAAFNHITPFPGTPLYTRLKAEGRLTYENWWMDERYRYNMIPFEPVGLGAEELASLCVEARHSFYSWPSIFRRARGANVHGAWKTANYFAINAMHQADVRRRNGLPMGDENDPRPLLRVDGATEIRREPRGQPHAAHPV